MGVLCWMYTYNSLIMDRYVELTRKLMQFKSVSTDKSFAGDVKETSEYLVSMFRDHGFEVETYDDYGNPIVLASLMIDESKPTVLVYGHYDVQPAEMEDGWLSEPFDFIERDGRFYGRGAIDNKGQFMVHVATVFELLEKKELAYNVKFLLEGDEETGSGDLPTFVRKYKDKLQADVLMLSDGELYKNKPTVELGFRGVVNMKVTVKSSHTDLHSGLYGGVAPSSAHEVIAVLNGIRDDNNMILIDDFYAGVEDISDEVIELARKVDMDDDEYFQGSGCKVKVSLPDKTFLEQTGLYPSVEVTGLESGYNGVGYRNSIPHKTTFKLNVRTSPVQDAHEMRDRMFEYFTNIFPEYLDIDIEGGEAADGVLLEMDEKWFPRVINLLEEAYGEDVVYKYCGGTLPIVADFNELFEMPLLMVPFANFDCGMHAANENFDKKVLEKALKFSKSFFEGK